LRCLRFRVILGKETVELHLDSSLGNLGIPASLPDVTSLASN
jgi:hypothetical protein